MPRGLLCIWQMASCLVFYLFSFFCYCPVFPSNCIPLKLHWRPLKLHWSLFCAKFSLPILSKSVPTSYATKPSISFPNCRWTHFLPFLYRTAILSTNSAHLSWAIPNSRRKKFGFSMIWAMGFVASFFKPAGQLLLLQPLHLLTVHMVFVLQSKRIGCRSTALLTLAVFPSFSDIQLTHFCINSVSCCRILGAPRDSCTSEEWNGELFVRYAILFWSALVFNFPPKLCFLFNLHHPYDYD